MENKALQTGRERAVRIISANAVEFALGQEKLVRLLAEEIEDVESHAIYDVRSWLSCVSNSFWNGPFDKPEDFKNHISNFLDATVLKLANGEWKRELAEFRKKDQGPGPHAEK